MPVEHELFFANQRLLQTLAGLCADGRLSHALLLEGENGLGKRRLARIIAAMALCKERPGGCFRCDSCKNILADNHPDVEIYGGAGGAGSFHIEDIRRLRQHAGILPNQADKRVFILENCENMTTAAQNALLKVLEEPPSYVMFILTAQNRNALLSTILSRVICFHLEELSKEEFARALPQMAPTAAGEVDRLYRASGGNLGLAIQMAGDEQVQKQAECAQRLLLALKSRDEMEMLSICAGFERDKEGFLACLGHLRRTLTTAMEGRLRGDSQAEEVLGGLSTARVMEVTDLIDSTILALRRNQNFSLTTTLFCASLNNICN